MILLLVAAQLSAPVPINRPAWFTPKDVPLEELAIDQQTVVPFRVTVAPDGRAGKCEIEASSGNAKVDSLTCELVEQRAQFRAASDASGAPAHGVYRSFARWLITEQPNLPGPVTTSDVEVTVAQLPAGVRSPAAVKVMFAVAEDGKTSSCVAERKQEHPALAKVACDQLLKSFRARPATTFAGATVSSVQNGTVLFVEQ